MNEPPTKLLARIGALMVAIGMLCLSPFMIMSFLAGLTGDNPIPVWLIVLTAAGLTGLFLVAIPFGIYHALLFFQRALLRLMR